MKTKSIRELLAEFNIYDEADSNSQNDGCHKLFQGRGPDRIYLGRRDAHEASALLDDLRFGVDEPGATA